MTSLFFIVGNSRSGTTLISRILRNHPDIHVLNETHFFEEFSSQIEGFSQLNDELLYQMINQMITIQRKDYYRKSEYEEYPEETNRIIAAFRKEDQQDFATLNKIFFRQEAEKLSKKRAGDQTPRHVFYIDEIFDMYPDAKVIHMVRDPRAVLFSQKKKWASGLGRKQPIFEVIRTFINYHPVTMSVLWNKAVRAGLGAQQRYGQNRVKTISFEAFVRNPEKEVTDLCRFLDIDYSSEMLDVSVELSAIKPQEGKSGVSSSVAEQWKSRFSETEISICQKYTGHLMKELEYPLLNVKTPIFKYVYFYIWFPFHLLVAFLLNLSRMGNPIKYISKRLINSKA